MLRFRNAFWWGWNKTDVKVKNILGDKVPLLIVYGEHDKTVNSAPGTVPFLSVPDLYKAIPGTRKLMFKGGLLRPPAPVGGAGGRTSAPPFP
ncbi:MULTISPECIES: hypothetical protein [unclassified Streptomyces]|uniref:hypothetical protein n=1 Tax=Streptomyces sp. NPDC127129 TaxID=3345373 RepID=UPI00363CAA8A